jgi:hypothetical protein
MSGVGIFSSWLVGTINGLTKGDQNTLSDKTKYTTLAVASSISWFRIVSTLQGAPKMAFAAATISAPLAVGAAFCLGTFVGKSIKESSQKIVQ